MWKILLAIGGGLFGSSFSTVGTSPNIATGLFIISLICLSAAVLLVAKRMSPW